MLKQRKRLFAAVLLLCVFSSVSAFAEVFTEKTGGGKANSVYVAGNPNRYPIEYYDSATDTYQGLMPELLKVVSEKTGIDFTYLSAGKENRQKSLYKNRQVELLTAISSADGRFEETEKIAVFTTMKHGEITRYYIGFTEVLSEESKQKMINALQEISEEQKTGFLLKQAETDFLSSQKRFTVFLFLSVLLILSALAVMTILLLRKKRSRERMNRMIDANTGVGNAEYYVYAVEQLISEQSKNLYTLAYLAFDTQAFEERKNGESVKNIEKYAAEKLNRYISSAEYLAHVDKGAFAILFQAENEQTAEKRAVEMVSGVNRYLSELVQHCDGLFQLGYCRFCEHVGVNAEAALYNAKQGYVYAETNDMDCHVGSKALADENKKAEALAAQIDSALANGEFKLYMQFITEGKSGKFCGAEVLSRWQNREYGLLRPHEYIAVFNKTGKIVEHDYHIFENACRQLAVWNKPPFDELFFTCNFTRRSFSKTDFAERLTEITQRYQVPHHRLVIEITEDTLSVDSDMISETIKRLSKLGFRVAIDDMGAGFSSLADIYDNEIDIVKIEKDFLSSCVTERRRRMLGDIITLVHNAGAKVICEGMETAEQVKLLRDMECDMMQGFYFSRVLPLSECEKMVFENAKEMEN